MDTSARPHRGELTALCYRQLRRTMRSPGKFIGISMNPVVMTLALGVLFVGAVVVPDGTDYRAYMVAGVALQVGLSCIGPSAVTTAVDQTSGLVVRSKTLPVRSWSVLAAQVVADLAAAVVALALVTALALVIGWRPHGSPVDTALAYVVLLAFYVAMIWVGILLGLVIRNPETLEPVGAVILVVLSFVSNAFLSPDTMPSGVRQVASWNPVSAVTTTCRQLWGTSTGTTSQAWPATHPKVVALVFVVVVAGVASILATRLAHRTARPGRTRPRRHLTLSLARASARHPGWAVSGWLVLIGACVGAAQVVGTVSATPVDLGVGPSGRAAELLHDAGLTDSATEYVLVGPRPGASVDPSRLDATARDLAYELGRQDQVEQVGQPFPSDDGTWLLLPFTLRGDPETAYERVDTVRTATVRVADRHPDVTVEQTGAASLMAGTADQLDRDFVTAETLSIPVTLLVLLVVFGAFVAAVVPVVLALTAVVGAVGLSALVSHVVPDSGMSSNMILLIGMAVGVDYSLFYLRREREERRKGASRIDAIETAAATSGHAVVFSSAAVIVSLAGLYLVGDTAFMSLASAAILVVAVAVVGSLTVLPALLVLLARFLDRPRVPFVWRLTNRAQTEDRPARFWPALLRPALARPALTMVVTMLALAALALPVRSLALATPKAEDLPASIPAVTTLHTMNTVFPQVGSAFAVVVQAEPAQAPQVRAALEGLVATQAGDPGAPAAVRTSADGRVSTVTVLSASDATSDAAKDYLLALRERLVPEALGDVPGAEAVVGGDTASDYDYDQNMRSTLVWVVGFVLLFNFLVMAASFRSLVVGVATLVMNLLSTGAAFGVLVLVFQHHWADGLLGYTTTGTVVSWVPLFLFVVLVGLSMDYHVFVLNRIHEAARSGTPHRDAVRGGIVRSAGVVTSAAVVMVAVFSVFGALSFAEFKQLAVGLGVAVLLDVIVVRGFLLPAILLVTGRSTWWPGPVSRLRPQADHDEATPPDDTPSPPPTAETALEPDADVTPDRGVPKVYLSYLSSSTSD